ncbi:MAG: hypothetical protein R3E56_10575 [Burkholderiaceae bacterium]
MAYYVVVPLPPTRAHTSVVDASCSLPNFQADWLQQVNAARAVARTCGGVLQPAAPACPGTPPCKQPPTGIQPTWP